MRTFFKILAWTALVDLVLLLFLALAGFFLPVEPLTGWMREAIRYGAPRIFASFRELYRHYGSPVLGYADRHSVEPGGRFQVMLSTRDPDTSVKGRLEVFRVGPDAPDNRRLVYSSPPLQVAYTESLGTVSSTGCNWPAADEIEAGRDWTSGYYSIDFVAEQGNRSREVAYIVVLNPKRDGQIAILLSTNTYQAYNAWGGHSLYLGTLGGGDKTTLVSFDRPTVSQFQTWEHYYVLWVETLGYRVDYLTNFDLYQNPEWASRYPLFIVLGHNEYFSKEEFDHVEDRIFNLGRNTLFLGANLAYWQVRYADLNQAPGGEFLGRQLVCHKQRPDPIASRVGDDRTARLLITDRFRAGSRRPESELMGVMFENYFLPKNPWHYPISELRIPLEGRALGSQLQPAWQKPPQPYFPEYFVVDNSLPFFAGTGLEIGESVGGLIGYEWDNRNPASSQGLGWQEGVSLNQRLPPESVRVVFEGSVIGSRDRPGKAEAVYFETPSGARVFSSGTIRWPWGLSREGFVNEKFKRFNQNLLRYMLESETEASGR